MKSLFLAAVATALFAAPAFADETPVVDNSKVSQLIVYGDDACPASTDDTIIVCARKPEGDRYRIPDNLRADPNDPKSNAWANRATELQYVGRSGIGSCSPTGPGGFTGCLEDTIRAARAERSTRDSVNWNRLIEEARRERLSRIDAQAEAVEAEVSGN